MSAPSVCPECGAALPANAPGGLCPRCLIAAAVPDEPAIPADRFGDVGDDAETVFGPSHPGAAIAWPRSPVDLNGFKRAVEDLGLIPAWELERFVAGALGGVPGLTKALVRAGKLTPYQAEALAQGKARGLLIGNYFILDKLGAGGMGVVFKARHRRLGRIVALKILPPSLARDNDLLSRFRREVDVAARLSHPNIVSVLDADEDRGVQFMTMEFIEGNDLDRLVRDGGVLPIDQALDCVIQAARGLEAAHAQGIVHRDIKPGNLMLDGSGVVRVLDLGLARLVEASNPFGETASGPLTRSGTYMGTIDFMAPEQGIDSKRVDHRADIYSLACTLCYLLTARVPFDGATVLARLMAHQDRAPASLLAARPDVPIAIDAVYQKMMAKKAADRPASMSEVIELLEACRSSPAKANGTRPSLKTSGDPIAMKPAAPKMTVRESVARLDEPAIVQLDNQKRPGAPAERTVIERLPLIPDQTETVRLRKLASPRSRTLAIGALALLLFLSLGYWQFRRKADNPQPDRSPPPPASPSLSTFSVVTHYITLGEDGNDASVESIAVTALGQRALIGSWTEYCELVDIHDGSKARPALGSHRGWQGGTPTVAMTPDGRRALIGTSTVLKENLPRMDAREAGILWCWDLWTGKPLFPKRQPYNGPVTSVAISSDGSRGLSGGQNGELTLWDLTTGEPLRSPVGQTGEVSPHAMAFFPDNRRAATAGADKRVHIWDLDTGRQQAAWIGHDEKITGLAISADGSRIVTGSDDATVILWDVARGEIAHRFPMPPNDTGAHVTFDSDGNIVAAGGGMDGDPDKPGNLIVWRALSPYDELRRDERPFVRHMAVAALPGGRVLTGDRYALRLWTPCQAAADSSEPPPSPVRDLSPVNLLALIEPQTYKIGDWQMSNGTLQSPTNAGARLQIPYAPPLYYRLDVKVERVGRATDYAFALGCVVGGQQLEIGIDHVVDHSDTCTGFQGLDGAAFKHIPGIHSGQLLFPNRPVRLSLTVRPDSIDLTCDGSSVLQWKGDPKRFIPYSRWRIPDRDKLFLCSGTAVKFHEMTLTPLTDASP